MNEEQRENEEIRQEKLEAGVGKIVPGAGKRGTPRRMDQMVSVRLDGELIGRLKTVARQRGLTLSELVREGAELVAQGVCPDTGPEPTVNIFIIRGARPRVSSVPDERLVMQN